ncbi:MAG TPA: UDP-glucose/GDP-mannose dehydrogenase family protein [Gemmatimonadales bacterium]|nr:UDP-glucose/GDP-mannose dehydrogenase family protein [Gemmatimonadales bacterium]
MKLSVVGSGYVGLVASACFAETGNDVVCVERDAARVARLRANDLPLFEPGLEPLVRQNQAAGRLRFVTDLAEAVAHAPVIFVAVGTPPGAGGEADLSHVLHVAEAIARQATEPKVLVLKSTVPVGTTAQVAAVVAQAGSVPFEVAANPEFLKEGAAVDDFMHPDRVVVGTGSPAVRGLLNELYAPYTRRGGDRILFMDPASAELTKYAANAMLATRVSFINQIAALCEAVGADVAMVRNGIGSDRRIGRAYLYPGPGYGGSCFPKDLQALIHTAERLGVEPDLLRAVEQVNRRQRRSIVEKVRRAAGGLTGRTIAVWGLAFKAETDDVRESPAMALIDCLLESGARVQAHDPKAMPAVQAHYGDRIALADDPYAVLAGADVLAVMTEWLMYRTPDFSRIAREMRQPAIVDGRNLYDPMRVTQAGIRYSGVGRRCSQVEA